MLCITQRVFDQFPMHSWEIGRDFYVFYGVAKKKEEEKQFFID